MTRCFLAYLLYHTFIIGGCTYLVFWKDASGWWYLLAILFCGVAMPGAKEENPTGKREGV